jgi:outer membrane receptor protein involved in Fe transport/outer membrane protein OmpA-like peptidoglycan-associated protein
MQIRQIVIAARRSGRRAMTSAAASLVLAAVVTDYATAQSQPETAGSESIEEVVVTARLRAENLNQAPIVATAVTGDELDKQGITSLQELEQIVPGIHIASYFQEDSIYVRGVGTAGGQAGFEEQVGLFVDGVYYGNGHWINAAYFDIASADVLEGPQGVYFGKNTIAGAFDIKTKDPDNSFDGYVKLGYEYFAQQRYGEAALSIPIDDTLSARVAFRGSEMQGWAKADLTGTSEPGTNETEGRITVVWKPDADFDATFKAQFDNYHDNGPFSLGVLTACAGPDNTPGIITGFGVAGTASCRVNTDIPTPQYTNHGPSYTDIPSYTSELTLHWRQSFGELTSITGLNRYSEENLGAETSSTFDALDQYNEAKNEQVSEELRYLTRFDGPINFLAGLYYQSSAFDQPFAANLIPVAVEGSPWSVEKITDQHDRTESAFAEVEWTPTDTLELDVGGRYTDERKDFLNVVTYVNPIFAGVFGGAPLTGSRDDKNFSPQAILTWKPDPSVMAFAAYKTGFLSGGYEDSFLQTLGSTTADAEFGPEKVKGGEIGTKFYLFDRSVQANIDAYYYSYTGLQVDSYDQATLVYRVENAADSVAKGIEVSGSWVITPGLKASAHVDYNKSEYTTFIGQCLQNATFATGCNVPLPGGAAGFEQDFKGVPTDEAPVWSGRADLEYTREIGPDLVLNTGIGLSLSDKYIVGDLYHQSGFARFDANASLATGPWLFALIGRNLTDQYTCDYAGGRTLGAPSELRCFISRGAELHFEATYSFGFSGASETAEPAVPPVPAAPLPAPPPPGTEPDREFQVFFDFDRSDITDAAAKVIRAAADAAIAGHVVHLTVTGHTDTVGTASYNQGLSERRAKAVRDRLVADGLPGDGIATLGVGKTGLLVPTADGVREPQNRRAVIELR